MLVDLKRVNQRRALLNGRGLGFKSPRAYQSNQQFVSESAALAGVFSSVSQLAFAAIQRPRSKSVHVFTRSTPGT